MPKKRGRPSKVKPMEGQVSTDVGYTVKVKIFGKFFTAIGETFLDALHALNVGKVGGIVILSVSHNGHVKDKTLTRVLAQRLFSPSPTLRTVAEKHVLMLFGL